MTVVEQPPKQASKMLTAEVFWDLSQRSEDDVRMELIEGELITVPPAGGELGEVVLEIGSLTRGFVKANRLERVVGAETGFILGRDEERKPAVLAPDAAFIHKTRARYGLPSNFVPYASDLAVEVISLSEAAEHIQKKVSLYLKAGTKAVWGLYPTSRSVAVYTLSGGRIYMETDVLEGGEVLPGFSVPGADLFPRIDLEEDAPANDSEA